MMDNRNTDEKNSDSKITKATVDDVSQNGRRHKFNILLIILAIITALLIVFIKQQKEPVMPNPEPSVSTIDYDSFVRIYSEQATARNMAALKKFETGVNRVLKEYDPKLKKARINAAAEASTQKSCSLLVYYMAWDKIEHGNKTDEYLNQQLEPNLKPMLKKLGGELSLLVDELETNLRESTTQLATDLARTSSCASNSSVSIVPADVINADIEQAVRNLGFNAVGVGVAVPFDIAAITSIAIRIFGKQAAKVAGSATAALADGPLWIGDAIAIGGLIWTGFDVYNGKKTFNKEINIALENYLQDLRSDTQKQILTHGSDLVKMYEQKQANMGEDFITLATN